MNRELHLQNVPTKRASSRKLYELLFTVMPEAQKPTQVVIIKNFLSRYQKQYNIGVHSRLLSDRSNTSKTSIAAQSGKVNSDWKMNVTVFVLKKKKIYFKKHSEKGSASRTHKLTFFWLRSKANTWYYISQLLWKLWYTFKAKVRKGNTSSYT